MTTHPWQNRIVGHEDVDPLTLKAHPKNFRTHANQQRRLMEAALDELGHVGEIVVNQNSRRILNGHLRVELAIGRAEETVPVTWLDVSDEEELVILAFFDSIGEQAKIDADRLRANFQAVTSQHDNLRTVMADWAASFQVTILPAKPAQAPALAALAVVAPPDMAVPAVVAQPAVVPTIEIEVAPVAATPVAAPAPSPAPAAAPVATPAAAVAVPAAAVVEAAPAAAPLAAPTPAEVEATPTDATVRPAVVEQPAEVAPAEIVAEETPAEDELEAEEMVLEGVEDPFANVFAQALAEDHKVVVAEAAVIAATVEEEGDGKGKKGNKEPAAPPAPPLALIKIGEYDQEIELAVFTPWFNTLVAHAHGDGHTLMQLIKGKLGIVT